MSLLWSGLGVMSQLGFGGLDHFIFFKANVFICECAFQGEGGTKRLEGEYFVYFVHSILFLFCK